MKNNTLHPVKARDTNISQRAEGSRADIDRGLIQGAKWENCMYHYIYYILKVITYQRQFYTYFNEDVMTRELRQTLFVSLPLTST